MSLINIEHLTKDYGSGRGLFDINLTVEKGEVFGFVGTNGAGKTTLIRHLLGFLKPQQGKITINGLDCWNASAEMHKAVGYIPGEIAFPDEATGSSFLKAQAELLGIRDMAYAEYLIAKLQLDPTANLKRMSKGMKQKTAIVAALMHDPDILIFDEPSTGLDPLMRANFIEIVNEEKKKGKTIFMSSHMFEEVENTCNQVAMIKEGKIIAIASTEDIRHNENKTYKIEFSTIHDLLRFTHEKVEFNEIRKAQNQALVTVNDSGINEFTSLLVNYDIKFITEIEYTLDKYFKSLYQEEKQYV